jgi:hypothetical protein
VEAVIKVMKTFPKCQMLQESACAALNNLAWCSIDRANAIESGGIEVVLAAITNHLDSAVVCQNACWALYNIILDDEAGTELLISLGGGAVLATVGRKWPDNKDVQTHLRNLAKLIAAEMTRSQPAVRSSYKSSEIAIASPEVLASSSKPTAPKVATGSSKMAAPSSQPVAPEDTNASPNNPTPSSQAVLVGVYLASSDRVSPSPMVPLLSSKARNDSQHKSAATLELVSEQLGNDYRCTSMEEAPEVVAGLEATGEGESIAKRVITRHNRSLREIISDNTRTDTSPSTVVSPQMNVATERDSTADAVSASNTEHDESIFDDQVPSIGTLVRYLFAFDNVAFDTAFHALRVDLVDNSTKWDHVVAVGSCFAIVPIMWLVVKEMKCWISTESV